MKSSLFSSLGDGFYYLGKEIIGKDYTIIAFSDLNGDGFTDIITYKNITATEYEFYQHLYNKEELKFEDPKLLFKISEPGVSSLRNLFVGNFYGDKTCYLVSFNIKDENKNDLLFTYIHRKTTEIKEDGYSMVYSEESSPLPNHRKKITKPVTELEKRIVSFFVRDKVFYQDNEVGEVVRNYLNWCQSK